MGSFDWDDMGESKMKAYSTVGMNAGISLGGLLGIGVAIAAMFAFMAKAEISPGFGIGYYRGRGYLIMGVGTVGFVIGAAIGGLLGAFVDKAIDRKKGI